MASISIYKGTGKHSGDTYRAVQFIGADRKRRSIRLAAMPEKDVDDIRDKIGLLETYRKGGRSPDADTAGWLGRVGNNIYDKLAAGGLVEARAETAKTKGITLGAFLEHYLGQRQSLVAAGKLDADTLRNERVTRDCLIQKFGSDKPLAAVTSSDAEDFRHYLLTMGGQPAKRCGPETVIRKRRPLAESTTRKRCSMAGKFFGYALRRGLIGRNPFDTEQVPKANIATADFRYIEASDSIAVLDQLPTTEWKLLFALCRWGGLRIGETRLVTWGDVIWDQQKMRVHSPKTRRYPGHESRMLPIFPELATLLEERYEQADTGDVYVLPMLQGRSDASLRKTVQRAIERAGVTPWPRLWHNLRGTRQNELEEAGHKTAAVCAWLGNSKAVSRRHYVKVTDADFAKAIAPLSAPPAEKMQETA